jgi:hypothetical protein
MSDRFRAVTLVLGVSAVLLSALFLAAGGSAAAKPATKHCSVAGLHYTDETEGTTFSVAVANLRAKVTSCGQARGIAGTVAEDMLQEIEIPARIKGLKITVKEPCTGCTPNTLVTAKSGAKLVTFTVKGGA